MSEYPSDLGHWERINESASAINYGRELNMHTVVEDVCRALIDLNEAIRTAKADAWDEGANTAWERSTPEVNAARYHWRHEGEPTNPYRSTP